MTHDARPENPQSRRDHQDPQRHHLPGPSSDHADQALPAAPLDHHQPEPIKVLIRPWHDPALAEHGVDPRGDYVERFWLGVVGPSVVFLLRRLARGFDEHPAGFTVSLADTARAIGLSGSVARNSPISRTIDRACLFGLMRRDGEDCLEVRTQLPRLTARQLRRLPLAVRNSHQGWDRTAADAA